jgi:hypothetical protein
MGEHVMFPATTVDPALAQQSRYNLGSACVQHSMRKYRRMQLSLKAALSRRLRLLRAYLSNPRMRQMFAVGCK